MDGGVRPSGLPKQTYVMPEWLTQYFQDQFGIVVGHQGFDNNILMAEAFMKILPQIMNAMDMDLLNNIRTGKKPKTNVDKLLVKRIIDIWDKGLYCLLIRDEHNPENIIRRASAYQSRDNIIHMNNKEYRHPWDLAIPCPMCYQDNPLGTSNADYVGFMANMNYSGGKTICFARCIKCGHEQRYDVEIKPPFKKMNPRRPAATNLVWVEIRAEVLIPFALEGVDLVALGSLEAGYGYILNNEFFPFFKSYEDITNSIDSTRFVSHRYFNDTMDILFAEWLFHFHKLLIILHTLITEKNRPTDETTKPRTPRMEKEVQVE